MQPDHTPAGERGGDFTVDSHPYACRCGAVVYWRATLEGLVIVGSDGRPHRARCPLRGSRMLTPRDRAFLADFDRPREPRVVVQVTSTVDPAQLAKVTDALAELPVAVDEVRKLGQNVARYAAQVDRRSASHPRAERPSAQPPASTPGEPSRGASVVRTRARAGTGLTPER